MHPVSESHHLARSVPTFLLFQVRLPMPILHTRAQNHCRNRDNSKEDLRRKHRVLADSRLGNRDTRSIHQPVPLPHHFHHRNRQVPLEDRALPPTKNPLNIKGKLIRNPTALISTLQDLISRRQTERAYCSLCFSTFHPTALNAACGRHGCLQRICRGCLSGWYGLNAPGRIINTAALSCPFCRRKPAARTLAKYGMGIHAVGNLAMAVQEEGHWIYTWCRGCGFAKQYMERVCARGMPPDVEGWACDSCREEEERRRLAAERERAERAVRDARMARDMQALEEAEVVRDLLRRTAEMTLRRAKECPGCGM